MVKVFTINSDGKIEFTKDELEKLLNEIWQDGRNSVSSYWWTLPTVTSCYTDKIVTPCYTDKSVEITCGPGKITCGPGKITCGPEK